jgi:hypothetical protein
MRRCPAPSRDSRRPRGPRRPRTPGHGAPAPRGEAAALGLARAPAGDYCSGLCETGATVPLPGPASRAAPGRAQQYVRVGRGGSGRLTRNGF